MRDLDALKFKRTSQHGSVKQNGYVHDIIQYVGTAPTIMLMSDSPLNLVQVMVGSVSSEMFVYNKKHVIDVVRMHMLSAAMNKM